MESWDTSEVFNFLTNQNISSDHANTLKQCQLSGKHLSTFTRQNFIELETSIPLVELINIRNIRDKYLSGELVAKNKERQVPRKFGKPVSSDLKYKLGSVLPPENTNYSNEEPLREFKEFTLDYANQSDESVELSFIHKLGTFAAACMNSRYDGTIYFGVSDCKDGKSLHGEIKGVNTSLFTNSKYDEWIEKHFRKNPKSLEKCSREEKSAFSRCMSSIQFVPIIDSDRVVIEIDIEPKFSICKFLKFKINSIKYVNGVYFLREGSSSVPLKPESKEEKYFISSKSKFLAENRRDIESYKSNTPVNIPQKLKSLLCKGEYNLPDDKCKYFLLINGYCTDECCKMSDFSDFDWVKHVNWKAIFDFNSDSAGNGLLSILQDPDTILIPPETIAANDFKEKLQNESTINMFLKSCQYGKRTLHITCVESNITSSDYNQNTFYLWRQKYFSEIKRLFDMLTGSECIDSYSDMVFVICPCSSLNQKEVEYFLKNICIKPDILNEFVFLAQSENHLKFVKEAILQEFDSSKCEFLREKSVILKWSDISAFVQQCKSMQTSKRYLLTSRKTHVIIKNEISEMFQNYGASILAANECEELFSEASVNLTSLFRERMKSFMQGKETTWSLFFFSDNINNLPLKEALPSALIEREIVDEIKNKIDQFVTNRNTCISLIGVGHLPGTGATTALMHVLWQNKLTFRCLLINGHLLDANGIDEMANRILSFRAFGEPEEVVKGFSKNQTCLPLLILLDNTTTEIAEILQRRIQNEITDRGIKFETTVGIILYIENRKLNVRNSKNLNEKFTPKEKEKFESKLNQYQNFIENEDLFLEDMLGFLTFMNSDVSDIYKDYVINIVDKIIDHLDSVYPTELKLLLYLAVFKCFIEDGNISVSHAYKVLGNEWQKKDHDMKNFTCEYFQMLVKQSEESKPGPGNYSILKITHLPVAKIILTQILKKYSTTVLLVVTELLENKAFIENQFLKSKLMIDLCIMAVRRQKNQVSGFAKVQAVSKMQPVKELFSMLILRIKDENNMNECVSILKKFIFILKNSREDLSRKISNVYQTLSRLYLEYSYFNDAKENAQEAIRIDGNHCTYDTLGQIFKKELEKILKVYAKKKEQVDLMIVLDLAGKAVKNFRKEQSIAQDEYFKSSTMEITDEDISDEDTIQSRIPGYLGEILVMHIVMEALLNRLPNEKQKIINYVSGKKENFHKIANENNIDIDKHGVFLQSLFERSQHCIETILKHADTEKIQNMDHLQRICKKQSEMFEVENDSKLLGNLMKSKLTVESKLKGVHNYCKINQLSFLAYVKEIKRSNGNKFYQMQSIFKKLKSIKKISELDSYLKICFLNANIGQNPILSFEDACDVSNELSNNSLEELQKYETFFWYMVFHWPTQSEIENKNLPITYDLKRLIRCIQKLKEIHDDNAKFVLAKKEQRNAFKLNPIYFLKDSEQYSKLEEVTIDTDRDRRNYLNYTKFKGKIKDQSYLEYILSDKTSLIIRAANLRWNCGSSAQYVTFHVGFTLAGPVAYNIENYDHIQKFNDAENCL